MDKIGQKDKLTEWQIDNKDKIDGKTKMKKKKKWQN